MATSFQRKTRPKTHQIPGAKVSIYNKQLLISSGIPTLDHLLGGGLALGTVLLIEEDVYGNYARVMLKYFCAEAVMTGHSLLLGSADPDPGALLKELPGPILDDVKDDVQDLESDSDMKIAWRYSNLPKFQSKPVKFGHYYDLTKNMDDELVHTIDITCVNDVAVKRENGHFGNPTYEKLLENIQMKIKAGGFETGCSDGKRNILRIVLHSIGSPLWGENGGLTSNHTYDHALIRFLIGLRAILRSAYATCVLTVPSHLFCDKVFINKIEKYCDTVVLVDSFVGSDKEKNPAFKDYHGLFHIRKLPCLNSLVCTMPESLDLAFKLRRKKFSIEQLHLPPDLSETVNRQQEDPVARVQLTSGCVTGLESKKLDF